MSKITILSTIANTESLQLKELSLQMLIGTKAENFIIANCIRIIQIIVDILLRNESNIFIYE